MSFIEVQVSPQITLQHLSLNHQVLHYEMLFRIMDKRCRRLLWALSLVRRRWIASWLRFMHWIILQKMYFAKSWSRWFIWSRKLYKMEMLLLCTRKNKETHRICRGTEKTWNHQIFLDFFLRLFFRNYKKQINSDRNGNKKKNEKQKSVNLWKPVLQPCKRQVTF